jgi:uncharacterized protein
MYINVAQLLKESVGSTRTYEIDETTGINGINHVYGKIKLVRANFCILVTGALHAEITDTCGRCICPFDYVLNFKLEDEFYPVVDIHSGTPITYNGECLKIDKNHIIDLDEAIFQQVQISKPLKPLCHPDCAGLCQVCGHNLNRGPCPCSHSVHATVSDNHK